MPAAFITMISESLRQLVEHVRGRDHQRDRRDHQDEQRNDQPGDADEDQDGLALAGHQVDVAQRLGDPDHRGQADQHDRNAPNVVRKMYRPIDPIRARRPPFRQYRRTARPLPAPDAQRLSLDPTPRQFTLIRRQSGRAKAKPLNMHNKK